MSAAPTKSGRSAVTKHLLNCSVHVAVAAVCLGAMIDGTTAGSFTRGCAARDLQILKLIEERENRMMCYDGHVVDALAIYDSVAGSLTPNNLTRAMAPDLTTGRAR